MTKAQLKKVTSIIEADANQRYKYYFAGKTCVIGGLLKASGWKAQALSALKAECLNFCPQHNKIAALLSDKYGLSFTQAVTLQEINDAHADLKARRKALIAYLEDCEKRGESIATACVDTREQA